MKSTLHQSTISAPGLVAFENQLFIGWAGTEPGGGLLHTLRCGDGATFTDHTVSDLRTNGEDVRLAYLGKHLCYGVKHHSESAPAVYVSTDDLKFTPDGGVVEGLTNARSDFGPAICNWKGQLIIAWIGTDDRIHFASFDGKSAQPLGTLDEPANCGVAIATDGNRLFVAWAEKGARRHLNVSVSTDGKKFGGKVVLREETTDRAPALAWCNGRLCLAWNGTKNEMLNLIYSGDLATFSGKHTLNESSSHSPTMAAFNNKLWLAWRGKDVKGRPNVMCLDS